MYSKTILVIIALMLFNCVFAQDKMPYRIYDKSGNPISYDKMIKAAAKNDVVLFGEYHDNSIIHWLQLEFAKDLHAQKPIVMGAEMFESDNQLALQDYQNGKINQKALDTLARLWPNYKTDYKPLLEFANSNKIKFLATNVPRRYASMVYKSGFEALEKLPSEDLRWIAPLPIHYDKTLPGYVRMIEEMGGHGGENLPKAQALKDVTMAHFIYQNLLPGSVFVHYNGTYHSDNFEGIYYYLKLRDPKLKAMTIACVTQDDIMKFAEEHRGKADYIITIDNDATKTH